MKRLKTTMVAGLLVFGCCIAGAQEGAESSTSKLLRLDEHGHERDSPELGQREALINAGKSQQQGLLDQARGELTRQQAESARLEHLFETQEAQIVAARATLDERLGGLKELYGVLQTVAADTQARFSSSLINLQFPDREAFLVQLDSTIASGTELASIEDIERLWYELRREIVESGKVVRFQAVVTKANGEQSEETIVRVGTFNIVSDVGYLSVTDDGTVAELARQPDSRFTDKAKDLTNATDGVVEFGLDVTRGGILGLLVESRTISDQINDGLIVGYVIIAVGLLGLFILVSRNTDLIGQIRGKLPMPGGNGTTILSLPGHPDVPGDLRVPPDLTVPTPQSPESSTPNSTRSVDTNRVWIDDSPRNRLSLLFATTRKSSNDARYFSGDRADQTTFGEAVVRIPEDRRLGQVRVPFVLKIWRYTLYRGKTNPKRHFILKGCEVIAKEPWLKRISQSGEREAMVFVHGFNVSFVESLFRCAQIARDIRYPGIPIVFSWASRGRVLDYGYDRNSALLARDKFVALLEDLGKAGVETIHVLAHSMGNFAVLDALASHNHTARPLRLGEILMAAPDIDSDQYRLIAPKVQAAAKGMTLYASANDKAMILSRKLAGNVPRAGDVPSSGPVLVDRIDAIDVSAVGDEVLGLNHGVFASKKSILNDVKLLLDKRIRPPSDRLAEIVGMPEGTSRSEWWRYVY